MKLWNISILLVGLLEAEVDWRAGETGLRETETRPDADQEQKPGMI